MNPRQPAHHVVPKCYQVTMFSPPNYNREKNGEAVSEVLLAGEPSLLGGKGSFPDGKMALLEDSCRQPVFSWQATLYLLYASSCPGVGRAGQQGLRLTDWMDRKQELGKGPPVTLPSEAGGWVLGRGGPSHFFPKVPLPKVGHPDSPPCLWLDFFSSLSLS